MVCGIWYSQRILLKYCGLGVKCFVNFISEHQFFFSLALKVFLDLSSMARFPFPLSFPMVHPSLVFSSWPRFSLLPFQSSVFTSPSQVFFCIVFSDFLLPSSYLLTVLSSLFSLPHHFLPGIKSSMAFSFTWTSLWAPYNCIDKPDRGAWFNKTPGYFQAVNSLEDNQLICSLLIIKIQKCTLLVRLKYRM